MDLSGKVCIITGSAQGLGKEFAKRLLQAGANVTISDVNEERGKLTLTELRSTSGDEKVHFVPCDVTKDEQLEHLFKESEEFFSSPVDMFVNNAGINTNLGWRKCMEVNIMAVMSATEMALAKMKGRKGCKIVNIGSIAGIVAGSSTESIGYVASKHGVVTLSRSLAANRKDHGVDVLCLCPSWADTEIVSGIRKELKPLIEKSVKSLGLMKVEDVGDAFVKLINSKNGTVLTAVADTPHIVLNDYSMPRILCTALVGKLLGKVFGTEVVESWQVAATLAVIFILLNLVIKYFLF